MKQKNLVLRLLHLTLLPVTILVATPVVFAKSGIDSDPVCQAYQAKLNQAERLKIRTENQRLHDQVLYTCRAPWFDQTIKNYQRFANATNASFFFKFSQADDEQRKRVMLEKIADYERKSGEKVPANVRDQLDAELSFYEQLPTLDLQERWKNRGYSATAAQLLNYSHLDQALDECYPLAPANASLAKRMLSKSQNTWMKYYFRWALAYSDILPATAGLALGGTANWMLGGAVFKGATKGVQASKAVLVKKGVNEKTLRYLKYGGIASLVGGTFYAWNSFKETSATLEEIAADTENQIVTDISSPDLAVENARQECLDLLNRPGDTWKDLAKISCDYYVNLANRTLMNLSEIPKYRCSPESEAKIQSIEAGLNSYMKTVDAQGASTSTEGQ